MVFESSKLESNSVSLKRGRCQMWLLNPTLRGLHHGVIAHSSCSTFSTYLDCHLCLPFCFSLYILSTLYQDIQALASNKKVLGIKNVAAPTWSLKCLGTDRNCETSLTVQDPRVVKYDCLLVLTAWTVGVGVLRALYTPLIPTKRAIYGESWGATWKWL